MIESAENLPDGTVLKTDICIVGAGAAGISMALRLKETGLGVLLLDGGSLKERAEDTDLYRGEVINPLLHSPPDRYRHRVLGGSTSTWGGRCIPFDPIDFEERDWIPGSGWPIAYTDVARYYADATEMTEAGDAEYDARYAVEGGMRPIVRGFEPEHFDTSGIERFSCPTDFGKRYGHILAESSCVRVLLDANCTRLVKDDAGGVISHIVVRTHSGKSLTVFANSFAIATGGIEVARLLLASPGRDGVAIGNGNDLVGRYYMCHIAGTTGELRLTCDPADVFHDYERTWDGIYCRRRLQLKPEVQRRLKTGNIVLRLHHPRLPDPGHGRGILSAIFLAKPITGYEYSKRLHGSEDVTPGLIARHAWNVLREPIAIADFLLHWMRLRTAAARKFPSLVVKSNNNTYTLDIHGEQVPNRESRITLADEVDRFGMPRVRVDWRPHSLDIETVTKALQALAADIGAAGIGELHFDPDRVASDMLRDGAYGGHHIGTARMAESPERGVVDRDCRVFGMRNLFIASSAVFPTSSQANPTLTIVALALRLADLLRMRPNNLEGTRRTEVIRS